MGKAQQVECPGPVAAAPSGRPAVWPLEFDSPTAAWTAQQIIEAFPDDSAPRYLLRDRDSIYGAEFRRRVEGIGIAEVLTAPRSPWQNPFAERVIGTIRRELLDHVIVLNEGISPSASPQLSPLLPRLAHAPRP